MTKSNDLDKNLCYLDYRDGLRASQIARIRNLPKSTVDRWIAEFRERGH